MNPVVPVELDAEMNAWAAEMRSIVAAWGEVGPQAGDTLAPGSPFSRDKNSFRASYPNATENLENAAHWVGEYVAAIAQYVAAIAALFESRQVVLSVWPLIRAELEIAGRVAWLLEAGTENAPISATQRIARFQMEFLASLCREKYTANQMRSRDRERAYKTNRDRLRVEILGMFPDAQVDWRTPGDEGSWVVSGEKYVRLGSVTKHFAQCFMGNMRGLYDVLSDCSHPSFTRLRSQSSMADIGEGSSELKYVIPRDLLEWQTRVSCVILYKSAHLVAGYFGLDGGPLEAWAERVPLGWFAEESK